MNRFILFLLFFIFMTLSINMKEATPMNMKEGAFMLDPKIENFLRADAKERFLRYVQIETQSDPESKTHPSTKCQLQLGRLLVKELEAMGLKEVTLDEFGYVYATLPASARASKAPAVTFCAHMDTSPSESGKEVKPVIHENYDGGKLRFAHNADLTLGPEQSPELRNYVGQNIITASGDTLLGADDKAGIAEIMAALAALKRFENLSHPELRIVFTPDEEIGRGTTKIDMQRLGRFGYTVDGGEMGELEEECFDAHEATLTFKGRNIHPGYAKNKMINAAAIAARFVSALPEHETPEHTEKREGFFHLTDIRGNENLATIKLLIRDFDRQINAKRVELLRQMAKTHEIRYEGLAVDVHIKDQYTNMVQVLAQHPQVVEKAIRAIEAAGLAVTKKPIRGGTDGAALSFMGMPTPNLFSGGMMFHSKTEWIPEIALQKAAEVIVHLCRLWAEEG